MVADRVLGLVHHQMTPRLALMAALCGASWSYEVAAAFLAFFLGVKLCAKTIENVTCNEQLQPQPLPADPLDKPPGVVGLDGVLIRSRKPDQWLEMKVGCFFSQVSPVSKDRNQVLDASFVAGAMQQWQDFEQPVTAEAQRRGLDCSEPIEFVADGAEGIWSLQQTVFPNAQTRLDLFHAKSKIYQRTEQAYPHSAGKKQHQSHLLDSLEKGSVREAIGYLQKHLPRNEYRQRAAKKLISYLERHQEHIPNYSQVQAQGGTVSSGLIEKGNDLIVVRRLKEDIMHWTREGADPIIQHRTAFINQHARSRTGPYDLAFGHNFVQ
jgi:hypothetical protein